MLSGGPNYPKLKTNLRLVINRLKLLEKKKTELAQKARREIADYIATNKIERAKIRVEHIIREDYMVEAMELVEMYCDLLLARFGLIQQMKTMDEGLAEAISSLIWVSPRMQADVAELKVVVDQLTAKYGKPYAQAARDNTLDAVNPRLVHKLSVQAPPKLLVEKYLIEIAKSHNVEYEPDQQVLQQEQEQFNTATNLIDFGAAAANLPPMPATSPFVMPNSSFVVELSVGTSSWRKVVALIQWWNPGVSHTKNVDLSAHGLKIFSANFSLFSLTYPTSPLKYHMENEEIKPQSDLRMQSKNLHDQKVKE
ncbi:IST1 [Cordylochernes scorpioides]|uniref:IST1 homolog n=1 Tax=Cordylochernes scorpioides TaxID=51811 RepID=A0ABY6KGC0_9ARAC|nr:IST1 [Cordylochernes scorpioides]